MNDKALKFSKKKRKASKKEKISWLRTVLVKDFLINIQKKIKNS